MYQMAHSKDTMIDMMIISFELALRVDPAAMPCINSRVAKIANAKYSIIKIDIIMMISLVV